MFKLTVVFSLLLASSLAARGRRLHFEKPEKFKHVEGCYIPEHDAVIPFDSSIPAVLGCMEYSCGLQDLAIVSCGAVEVDPPLRVINTQSLRYPYCCPSAVGRE